MLTLPITYTNFNGKSVTKNFFFNITKAEIALRELESDGTWSETLNQIKNSDQGSIVMPEFKKIIKWCYGEKSLDGESFVKSDEAYSKFENSEAWSVLIMNLLTDAEWSAQFIEGVMPADMIATRKEQEATSGFRPGANTDRPTVPSVDTVGSNGTQSLTNPVFPAIQEPVIPDSVDAHAPQNPPSEPDIPEENPVQHISTPREDLAGS